MQSKESLATSRLVSLGCWIEPSDGHTKRVSFNDVIDCCVDVTHSDLQQLAFLPKLEEVCFYGVPVDGRILSSLPCTETLSDINLNCTSVTPSEISLIERFPNLKMVGLMETSANDECVNAILSCSKITNLRIDGTDITPSGMMRLATSLDLDTLWIGGTQISSESLASIAMLSKLREFHVCGESVVDSHVDALLTFAKSGRQFSIRHTRISRPGLDRLAHIDPNASNVE